MSSFSDTVLQFVDTNLTIEELEQMLIAVNGEIVGLDTEDNEYESLVKFWDDQLQHAQDSVQPAKKSKSDDGRTNKEDSIWYQKAFEYWESEQNCPISDDGVLGGYGKVTPMDTRDSNIFLDCLLQSFPSWTLNRVADCGAGIGRVTKHLLLPRCKEIDLVEQSPRLTAAAPQYLSKDAAAHNCKLNYITQGLQDFAPGPNSYDLIWIQWVIGHLHDLDCIRFFRRCARGLRPGGLIVLKDNMLMPSATGPGWTFLWDRDDSSVARQLVYIKLLAELAGLEVVRERQQKDFPEELYPVWMLALQAPCEGVGGGENDGGAVIEKI